MSVRLTTVVPMYACISEELKAPLEREVRRMRLHSALKHFPVLVVIFTGFVALVVFTRGHRLVEWAIEILQGRFTYRETILGFAIFAVGMVAVATAVLLRVMCREKIFERHFYCAKCEAVDNFDDAKCPVCGSSRLSSQEFFYTTYEDEIALAGRFGLVKARQAQLAPLADTT